jgi:hypothetical protein
MSAWGEMRQRSSGGTNVRKEDAYKFVDPSVIDAAQLAKMLNTGIVRFKFRKKAAKGQPWDSGKERIAWGTRVSNVITKIPHGGDCPPKRAGYSIYFDLEKDDWRAFNDNLLLGVCPTVFTEEEFKTLYPLLVDETE